MRTTLTLDDGLARALKRIAGRRGVSFKAAVNEVVRRGISEIDAPKARSEYRTKTCSFEILPGLDPLKLGQVADEMDDAAKARAGS